MAPKTGETVEGKVTGLTKFGAFVDLGEGVSGMVHISEVASAFVNDINDYLEIGQEVRVKVLGTNDAGKISLSLKQAEGNTVVEKKERPPKPPRSAPNVWQGQKQKYDPDNMSFEEMMSKWKTHSDEKMADLKRSTDPKHSGYGKRGGRR